MSVFFNLSFTYFTITSSVFGGWILVTKSISIIYSVLITSQMRRSQSTLQQLRSTASGGKLACFSREIEAQKETAFKVWSLQLGCLHGGVIIAEVPQQRCRLGTGLTCSILKTRPVSRRAYIPNLPIIPDKLRTRDHTFRRIPRLTVDQLICNCTNGF